MDILTIAESKLDSSFPNSQFIVSGYKPPIRLDVSDTSGGLLVYVKSGLSVTQPKGFDLPEDIQIIPLQLNLKNQKWLLLSVYRPPKQNLNYFLQCLSDIIDFYKFERCIINGDLNSDPKHGKLDQFLETHSLFNHIKSNTCFKSEGGSCIDLILSNHKNSLQYTGSFDCGLSDFHHLIYTMLKSTFVKLPPKKIVYRCYRNFCEQDFLNDLIEAMSQLENFNLEIKYEQFEKSFESVLDKHAPMKSKYIRGSEKSHMDSGLKKAIMKRTNLLNKFRKTKSSTDLNAYRAQRNLVTHLNRKAKKQHFEKAIECSKSDSKVFWKSCKSFFSNSDPGNCEINLNRNGLSILDDAEITKTFNEHYNKITKSLDLHDWNPLYQSALENRVLKAIDKFQNHPSIINIKSNADPLYSVFKFHEVSVEDVHAIVMKLDCSKKVSGPIPTKILKNSSIVFSPILTNCINHCIRTGNFPNSLKLADITPVPKQSNCHEASDYRPISILPLLSKVFERVFYNQLEIFFENKFSKFLCGFRKRHSCQHALISLLKSWQNSLDEGKVVGTVLMDLSKAYDCLPHDLLIAKLSAYGVDFPSLTLLDNYLNKRHHRVKIGASYSEYLELTSGVPQGSILGPLLFNIFINDFVMSVQETEICNFADDNSLYTSGNTVDEVKLRLQRELIRSLNWFKFNSMAANPKKFQVMFLGTDINDKIIMNIDNISIASSDSVKLLGICIDCKLDFQSHIKNLCKSASQKTSALFRIRPFINLISAKRICSAFILSAFRYCPLIWMFSRKANEVLINKTHKRALRAVYNDFQSPFTTLLERDQSVTIHVQNLRTLMVEVFRSINRLNPQIMRGMFELKPSQYNLRSGVSLKLPHVKTSKFGLNSISFRGSVTWNCLPVSFKCANSIHIFKSQIKSWDGKCCTCNICR